MDYMGIGDTIDYDDYNAIVYILRKFKRLKSNLKLGNNIICSDYGTYTFSNGLRNIDGNYIIESPVTISSDNCLLNCYYTFNFNIINVDLSGEVNMHIKSVTGYTGDDGTLSINLPTDLLESDEVILSDFTVDITFDEHEYYTPTTSLNISLSVDKQYIIADETNTITAIVTDEDGDAKSGLLLSFLINGEVYDTDITNEDGEASITYTGMGTKGKVVVTVGQISTSFFDGGVMAEYTGDSITLGSPDAAWLASNGEVIIDWDDGTIDTVKNPVSELTHIYNDRQNKHIITFIGDITSLGKTCFSACTGLTSIVIPNSVTSLGTYCFQECTGLTEIIIPDRVISLGSGCFFGCSGLTSVTIPSSVTSLSSGCFYGCNELIDYQLYWAGYNNIVKYDGDKMPNNPDSIFTIPAGETENYIDAWYPSTKLSERGATYTLSVVASESAIYIGEDVIITGILTKDGAAYAGQSISIYDGATLVDIVTTDSNGAYTKTVTGLTAGSHTFKSVYGNTESDTVTVTVNKYATSLSIDVPLVIVYSDAFNISGALTSANNTLSDKTVKLKIGSTIVDTTTTDNEGEYEFTHTPVHMGIHTFQVVFDGDNTYLDSSSSTVTRNPSKETSVLSVTSPADNIHITTEDNLTVTGSLTDDDSTALTNKSVLVKENDSTLTTLTTDSTGAFSGSVSDLTVGTHSISIEYMEDDYYTSSTVSRTVIVDDVTHDYNLALSCDTPIIQSGDSATVIATLTDNNIAVSGVTLDYEIKHGSTTLGTGTTDPTDNNGQTTVITYTGIGLGDIDVIVYKTSMSLQETFVIEDCDFYNTLTSDNNLFSLISGSASLTYSNNGLKYQGTANTDCVHKLNHQLPNGDYSVEYTVTDSPSSGYSTAIATEDAMILWSSGDGVYARKISTSGDFFDTHSRFGANAKIRIEVTGTTSKTIKYYLNGTFLGQGTTINQNREFKFRSYNGRMIQIKNLKVKAL